MPRVQSNGLTIVELTNEWDMLDPSPDELVGHPDSQDPADRRHSLRRNAFAPECLMMHGRKR